MSHKKLGSNMFPKVFGFPDFPGDIALPGNIKGGIKDFEFTCKKPSHSINASGTVWIAAVV
jgi:hypothetical protein